MQIKLEQFVEDVKERRFYSVCYKCEKKKEDSSIFGKSIPTAFGDICIKWWEGTIDEQLEMVADTVVT